MKILFLLFAFILTTTASVEAQKLRTLYYTSYWELTTKDSAEFYRTCQIDTVKNKFLGEVNDFNMQGRLLMKGIYENGIKNGLFTFYYPTGQIESQGKFLKNSRVGEWDYFYEDGKLLRKVKFSENSVTSNDFFVMEAFDSGGGLLIKDGTGDWINTYDEFGLPGKITVKGNFVNGKKENDWVCFFSNGETLYKENFKNGKFKSGYLTNPNGTKKEEYKSEFQNKFLPHYKHETVEKFVYRVSVSWKDYPFLSFLPVPYIPKPRINPDEPVFLVVDQPPQFNGGLEAMYQFIGKNMKYPASARRMNIQGEVTIAFVVEADGTITDAKITKGISADCDREALRVVNRMPNWVPGKNQGRAVAVKFVLPIKFKLD